MNIISLTIFFKNRLFEIQLHCNNNFYFGDKGMMFYVYLTSRVMLLKRKKSFLLKTGLDKSMSFQVALTSDEMRSMQGTLST